MHTVVTAWESEVYVASAEFYGLGLVLVLRIGTDDGRVVDRLADGILQYTALLPHLIGAGKYVYIVEHHGVVTHVAEYQQSCRTVEQGLDRTIETFDVVQQDMLRLLIVDIVGKVGILALRNMELAGHRVEHVDSL